jgi:hypothetical protein
VVAATPDPPPSGKRTCDPILDLGCKETTGGRSGGGGGNLPEKLSQADVLVVIKGGQPSVQACARKNGVTGLVKVKWNIEGSGKTTDVTMGDSKYAGTPFASCVAGEVRKWKFGRFTGPTTPVTFPFKFGE